MPILHQKPLLENKSDVVLALPGWEAHQAGRHNRDLSTREYRWLDQFNTAPGARELQRTHWKSYPSALKIKLSGREEIEGRLDQISLGSALRSRRSIRKFSGEGISLETLSVLLSSGYGSGRPGAESATPSGGARRPIEIYICALKIKEVPQGYYHYNRFDHVLELVTKVDDPLASLECAAFNDPNIDLKNASFVVVLTSVFHRTLRKYGHRGWRYLYLDAGHLGQNLWLTATALGLGACAYGGGFDSVLAEQLGLSPAVEAPLIGYIVGQKPGNALGK